MKNLNFPEISKEIQQSVYGAWGGSNSNDPNGGWFDNGDGITIITNPGSGGSGGSDGGFDWNSLGGGNDNGGFDFHGSGGGGGESTRDISIADGILEDPNATELWWLLSNTDSDQRDRMRHNIQVASEYAATQPGLHNGQGDALRHALWSALDAADIGIVKATAFHTLHETSNPAQDGSNAMDLHNNDWGFQWFSQNGNPDNNMYQFMVDFLNAVSNGQIQTAPRP